MKGDFLMIYLSSFKLSDRSIKNPNIYPYNVFHRKDIDPFIFAPITVLYGNNGSGKSIILNIIANKLMLTGKEYATSNSFGIVDYCGKFSSECQFSYGEDEFGNAISAAEKKAIATLIYYPEQKLEQVLKTEDNLEDWYKVTLYRLIRICKNASSKYTRSKVRKALPKDFAYVIEELLTGRQEISDQEAYYNEIIRSVIRTGRAAELVIAFCNLIRRLVVDHLHVVGDIFDRGPYPNLIMDTLMEHHSVDIQWGNHDVYWMGAASGSAACICNVIRISAKYGNLDLLEDGYGINLVPLARFAMKWYDKDSCDCFKLDYREDEYDVHDAFLDEKMHKAITIMQFKLEGQLIKENPEFEMEKRLLLDKINIEKGTVCVEETEYPLKDVSFPTIDWEDPYRLSEDEADVMERLVTAFVNCEKLQRHVRFLYTQGSLYKVYNGNLLYHGCVPLNEDGTFTRVNVFGKEYAGKELYDVLEGYARKGYYAIDPKEKKKGQDIFLFGTEDFLKSSGSNCIYRCPFFANPPEPLIKLPFTLLALLSKKQ